MKREDYPNVTEVRDQARARWEKRQKKRRTRLERLAGSIDLWIVLIVLSFVLLSIPHTMTVFDMITPTLGKTAFIGLELGLLYRAFRGRMAKQRNEAMPAALTQLARLLFVALVMANGVGAFIAIADAHEELESKTIQDIFSDYGQFPADVQIALMLVPIAALMIPIGTIVGGEGLAALVLEMREVGDPLQVRWADVQQDIEFMALRDAAINAGATPKQAIRWASSVVGLDTPRTVSSGHSTGQRADTTRTAAKVNKTDAVFAYLDVKGDGDLSVREFAETVSDYVGVPIGRTLADNVRKEWRASQNGHGGQDDE
jgi:hypothetical protein